MIRMFPVQAQLEDAVDSYFDLLKQLCRPLISKMGLSEEQFQSGLDDIRDGIHQIGIEARRAERKGLSFTEAAQQDDGFLYLKKFHIGVRDFLQWQLPKELLELLIQVKNMPFPARMEGIKAIIWKEAYFNKSTTNGAFCRFLLFQNIRLTVLVGTWEQGGKLRSSFVDEKDLEMIAEDALKKMLEHPEDMNESIDREAITTAATMERLEQHQKEVFGALAKVSDYFWHMLRMRGLLEDKLRAMSAKDAALVRNFFSAINEEQRLGVTKLRELHPLLFRKMDNNAIEQQVSRKIRQIKENNWPKRKKTAFIDLVLETAKNSGL